MRSINVSNGYWVANATWMAFSPSEISTNHPLLQDIKELASVANGELAAIKAADQYLQRLFLWHTMNLNKLEEIKTKIVTTEFKRKTILEESFPNFKNKDERAKTWREVQTNLTDLELRIEKAGKRLENYEMNISEEVLDLISRKYGTSDYEEGTLKKWRDSSTAKKYDFEPIAEQRKKFYADFERLQRKADSERLNLDRLESKLISIWEKNKDDYIEHEALLYIEKELIDLIKEKDLQESIVKSNTLECMEARRKIYTSIYDYHEKNSPYILKLAKTIHDWHHHHLNPEIKLLPKEVFLLETDKENNSKRKTCLQNIGWAFINQSELVDIVEKMKYPYWIAMAYGNTNELTHVQLVQSKMNPPEFKNEHIQIGNPNHSNSIGIA